MSAPAGDRPTIPAQGHATEALLAELAALRGRDADWRGGKVFSLVYHAGEAHEHLLHEAHALYSSANLLNPMAFRSVKRMESDIVQMTASMLNAPSTAVGTVTSGGTESILVAVAAYRDRARKERRFVRSPELVVPQSIHPAFDKAAHYFGIKLRKAELDDDYAVDVHAMKRLINRNTIGLVASAPQYPHGVVDPIAELGALAVKYGLPMHVDACVGGFILPWIEQLGRSLPTWDFRVPGVTSMSADLHKYGYTSKGASVLLWRSMEAMKYQFFIETGFPGGVYATPTMIGTRPGGPIAAAWASLSGLGASGFMALADKTMQAADGLRAGLTALPDLELVGRPDASIVAYTTRKDGPNLYAVADRLEAAGWSVDRQHKPASIHLTVTANHLPVVAQYVAAVAQALTEVRANPGLEQSGTAPMYGMAGKIPLRGLVDANIREVISRMYMPGVVVPEDAQSAPPDGLVGKVMSKFGPQLQATLDKVDAARDAVKAARQDVRKRIRRITSGTGSGGGR